MPSSLQVDQIQSADGNTTYLNSGTLSNLTFPDSIYIAGTGAFMASGGANAWTTISSGQACPFSNDSSGSRFDTDGNYNTSTYKYEVPATGVYLFYYGIYTANADSYNAFGFKTNSGIIDNDFDGSDMFTQASTADDHIQTATLIIPLNSGDTIWVIATTGSDFYQGHSYWGGCRLK